MSEAVAIDQSGDYAVKLELFSGPLDLLLHLIKMEEVDIYDIPIARITSQYLRYVELIKNLDLELAGEFILMAATLIRIKTRLLLPQDDTDSDEPDPREELIMALVEYKKYKEAGEILRESARVEERNWIPPSKAEGIESRVDLVPMTGLYDLVTAFRDVISSRTEEVIHSINAEQVSIEERMKVIVGYLKGTEFTTFGELFKDMPRKIVAIVTFIALLELARARRIQVKQAVPFSELRIYRGEDFNQPLKEIDITDYSEAQTESVGI